VQQLLLLRAEQVLAGRVAVLLDGRLAVEAADVHLAPVGGESGGEGRGGSGKEQREEEVGLEWVRK
jgi:hypothetical protein